MENKKLELHREFQVYMVPIAGLIQSNQISQMYDRLLVDLKSIVSEDAIYSREFALARTKLEEACFYSKKAHAKHYGCDKTAQVAETMTDSGEFRTGGVKLPTCFGTGTDNGNHMECFKCMHLTECSNVMVKGKKDVYLPK